MAGYAEVAAEGCHGGLMEGEESRGGVSGRYRKHGFTRGSCRLTLQLDLYSKLRKSLYVELLWMMVMGDG